MGGPNAFAKTFSIEYTSLIIIILSFVVAAFNQTPALKKPEEPLKTLEAQQILSSIGIYHLSDLFLSGSNNLSTDVAGELNALVQVIKSHDVYVHARLFNAYEETSDRDLALGLALERAQTLKSYLNSIGIDDKLVRLVVVDNKSNDNQSHSEFEFFRMQGS